MRRTEERARALERAWAERGSTPDERRELAALWYRLGCPGRDPRVAPAPGDVLKPTPLGGAWLETFGRGGARLVVDVAPESWCGSTAWIRRTHGTIHYVRWPRLNPEGNPWVVDPATHQTLAITGVAPEEQHNTWQADMRGARILEHAGGVFEEDSDWRGAGIGVAPASASGPKPWRNI